MLRLLVALLPALRSAMRARRDLVIENPALRKQLATLVSRGRPVIRPADHVIVLEEHHLRRLLDSFVAYYNRDRTHLGVGKDSPLGRPLEQCPGGVASSVVSLPRVGGLHHRYAWRQAA